MATVRVEATIDVSAEQVWDAVADVGAVHQRLLPGRVADVLPHAMAGAVRARVERGIVEMKQVLESGKGPAGPTF